MNVGEIVTNKLLIAFFVVLLLSTLSLIGLYAYTNSQKISVGKLVENTLDFVYGAVSGGKRFYVPKGITLESKESDGVFLYSLYVRVINIDLKEKSLLVETRDGKLLNFDIGQNLHNLGNGNLELSVFEANTDNFNLTSKNYSFIEDNKDSAKNVLCNNALTSITWADKKPINYWEGYLANITPDTLISIPNIGLNFIINYNTQGLYKEITIPDSYICS